MIEIAGIQCPDCVGDLLERAQQAWAPRDLRIGPMTEAPPELPERARTMRGVFHAETPGVFVNTGRDDVDAFTVAHELGHAILQGRGWPGHPRGSDVFPSEVFFAWADLVDNRLQHIAMEPILRDSGFDTAPGHAKRLTRDLTSMRQAITSGESGDDPQTYTSRGVKLAEALHCAPRAARRQFRRGLAELSARAIDLGERLAAEAQDVQWDSLSATRGVMAAWLQHITDDIARYMDPGTPNPLEWVSIPMCVGEGVDLADRADVHFELVAASIQPADADKLLMWVRARTDGSNCGFVPFDIRTSREEARAQLAVRDWGTVHDLIAQLRLSFDTAA